MKFFKTNRRLKHEDAAAGGVNKKVLNYQRKCADYLNSKARDLSLKARVFGLIIFCVVCCSYLLHLLFSSIR